MVLKKRLTVAPKLTTRTLSGSKTRLFENGLPVTKTTRKVTARSSISKKRTAF